MRPKPFGLSGSPPRSARESIEERGPLTTFCKQETRRLAPAGFDCSHFGEGHAMAGWPTCWMAESFQSVEPWPGSRTKVQTSVTS